MKEHDKAPITLPGRAAIHVMPFTLTELLAAKAEATSSLRRVRAKAMFTLIELLVVVAIIAILMSILLPSLRKARSMARRVKCTSNQKQIAVGLFNYANDWQEYLPQQPATTTGVNRILNQSEFQRFASDYLSVRTETGGGGFAVYARANDSLLRCPDVFTPDHDCWNFTNIRYSRVSYPMFALDYPGKVWPERTRITRYIYNTKTSATQLNGAQKLLFGDHFGFYTGATGDGESFTWRNHDNKGANFAYPDGHVRWFNANDMYVCSNSNSSSFAIPKGHAVHRGNNGGPSADHPAGAPVVFIWNSSTNSIWGGRGELSFSNFY